MASTDFHINGPTVIRWYRTDGGSPGFVELGYTDNDDLVRVSVTDHKRIFSRNDTGDMISQVLYSGTTATLDFTMIAWDDAVLEAFLCKCRTGLTAPLSGSNAQGQFASVGGVARTGNPATERVVNLVVTPVADTPGTYYYQFDMVLNSGPEYMDFGNAAKRIAMSFVGVYSQNILEQPTFANIGPHQNQGP
jgi:hypothetical protein